MGVHTQRAHDLQLSIEKGDMTPVRVSRSARQGDLAAKRIGDAHVTYEKIPFGGIALAVGKHGEHRLVGTVARVDFDKKGADLPEGGVIVHTDTPKARHAALELAPGRWAFGCQRELSVDNAVQKVQD